MKVFFDPEPQWNEYIKEPQEYGVGKKYFRQVVNKLPCWDEVPDIEPDTLEQLKLGGDNVEIELMRNPKSKYRHVNRNYGVPNFKKGTIRVPKPLPFQTIEQEAPDPQKAVTRPFLSRTPNAKSLPCLK